MNNQKSIWFSKNEKITTFLDWSWNNMPASWIDRACAQLITIQPIPCSIFQHGWCVKERAWDLDTTYQHCIFSCFFGLLFFFLSLLVARVAIYWQFTSSIRRSGIAHANHNDVWHIHHSQHWALFNFSCYVTLLNTCILYLCHGYCMCTYTDFPFMSFHSMKFKIAW